MYKNHPQALLLWVNLTFLISQKVTCMKITLSFSSNITITALWLISRARRVTLIGVKLFKHVMHYNLQKAKVESENQSSCSWRFFPRHCLSFSCKRKESLSVWDTLSLVNGDGEWNGSLLNQTYCNLQHIICYFRLSLYNIKKKKSNYGQWNKQALFW